MNDTQRQLIKAAIAALSQPATFPADINYAKQCLNEILMIDCEHSTSFDLEYGYRMCITCGEIFFPLQSK